ncbi:MAG: cupin domain-containing protein [Gammaproteobacteria bacterium]|nr:cupin domain-containing protein [Gammaproteobacteria bacterium]MBI5619227.1 cupin domain-containing protein [Gammaproteobacteria bacterium]
MSLPTRIRPDDFSDTPLPAGRLSHLAFLDADLELRHYAPRGVDPQTPHDRDELYIVISGSGTFVRGAARVPFGPGDVLFAAAHETHRFEDFGDDFATWVVFYGAPRAGGAA